MALSAGTMILSVKTVLIFAGTVTVAMAMRSFLPLFLCDLRTTWGFLMACLKPPYLYFIINGIILAIVFASRFQHERLEKQLSGSQLRPLITARTPPPVDFVAFAQPEFKPVVDDAVSFGDELEALELKPVVINGYVVGLNEEKLAGDDAINEEEEKEVCNSAPDPPPEPETEKLLLSLPAAEKPLVTSRFAHRKPSAKASPEGVRSLRVARPKKQETLESTWRMITEGRHVPLTRHLRKSDPLENQSRHVTTSAAAGVVANPTQLARNEESPKAAPGRSPGMMRKEPSLGQDELNRRVEAFIKKFNEEMRIQRQQSLQQYMEMIKRGAN